MIRSLIITLLALNFAHASDWNWGWRSGSDLYPDLPEHSLALLRASLGGVDGRDPIQPHNDFEYLEFSVQESADGELIVFHDDTVARLLPYTKKNVNIYELHFQEYIPSSRKKRAKKIGKLKISQLPYDKLKRLYIDGNSDQHVPTLEEYLATIRSSGTIKPVAIEIRNLLTDEGREKLLSLFADFRDEYLRFQQLIIVDDYDLPEEASFVIEKKLFSRSFGKKSEREFWCDQFFLNGFVGVSRVKKHRTNLCD